MNALLERNDLDEAVLGVADELADQFVADLSDGQVIHPNLNEDELRLALAGLQLTFLAKVAKLVTGE
jgi:hypothetical protein